MEKPDIYISKILLRHAPVINFYPVAKENIQKGEFLGLFAGEFTKSSFSSEHAHGYPVPGGFVDAAISGSMSRYAAHLPSSNNLGFPGALERLDLPTHVKPASRTINVNYFKHNRAIKPGLFASRDIPAGCPLGWPYLADDNGFLLLDEYSGNPIIKVKANHEHLCYTKVVDDVPTSASSITNSSARVSTVSVQTSSPIHAKSDKSIAAPLDRGCIAKCKRILSLRF